MALVAGGLTSTGSGIAVADGHGATATGGSSAGSLFEQNTAQNSRQNNNCATTEGVGDLVGAQVEGNCASGDTSFNEEAEVLGGGAHAVGGSASGGVGFQQNTAQKGRQNNNCDNAHAGELLPSGAIGSARVPGIPDPKYVVPGRQFPVKGGPSCGFSLRV